MGKKSKKVHSGKPVSLDVFLGNARDPTPSQVIHNDYADETKKARAPQEIVRLVSALKSQGTLTAETFHLCHFNHMETSKDAFLPCEVGVVKYSLDNGVTEHYHEFISPGDLPLGYAYEAKDHSDKTHRIPQHGFVRAKSDYLSIMDSLRKMLEKSNGKMAPLFVYDEDIRKALFIVDWLKERCYEQDNSYEPSNGIEILSLNVLLSELRRQIDIDNPYLKFTSIIQVSDFLTQTKFLCYGNLGCKWHYDEDRIQYCSLALARNYAYVISDLCCERYGIQQLPDRHCPAELLNKDRYELVSDMRQLNLSADPTKQKEEHSDQPNASSSCAPAKPTSRGRGSLLLK